MSTHWVCNKLQKWITFKSSSSMNCQNSHCSHTHAYSGSNSLVMGSPYKKTTFETLLRRYPQNQDDIKSSRASLESKPKQIFKRTFESRILKYDNVKSKIDTNLRNLKQSRCQPNDENKNTQNLTSNNLQTENEKLAYQKRPIKKIKLDSEYLRKFEQPNDQFDSCVDVEDMIMKYDFRPTGYQVKMEDGQTLFRINVAKKINLFNQKSEAEDQISFDDQKISEMEPENETEKIKMTYPLDVENFLQVQAKENDQQKYQSPIKLPAFQNSTKILLKNFSDKLFKIHQNEENQLLDNEIFTLDGFRILVDSEKIENGSTQKSACEIQSHPKELQNSEIPLNQIKQIEEEENNFMENEEAQPIELSIQPEAQIFLPLVSELVQSETNFQPLKPTEGKQNISQNIQADIEEQKPKLKVKKTSKAQKETKILTRAKLEKLNLLNQLSMRLIRKKYGQDLTHAELAEKMLSHENRIELKAFIENQSLQSQKTVFDFNELTQAQMKNTLIKYFASEEKSPQ